jgi:SsrA-binding protein
VKKLGIKVIATNRKARHEFFIEDTIEAGIVLTGTEVKSIRQSKVNIKESFASIDDGEAYVNGMHISPYDHGNIHNVDPIRKRKLLLHKKEIRKLIGEIKQKGFTLVPLSVYLKDGKVKVEIAIAKGKKNYDKRDTIAKKDAERRMQQQSSEKYQ